MTVGDMARWLVKVSRCVIHRTGDRAPHRLAADTPSFLPITFANQRFDHDLTQDLLIRDFMRG